MVPLLLLRCCAAATGVGSCVAQHVFFVRCNGFCDMRKYRLTLAMYFSPGSAFSFTAPLFIGRRRTALGGSLPLVGFPYMLYCADLVLHSLVTPQVSSAVLTRLSDTFRAYIHAQHAEKSQLLASWGLSGGGAFSWGQHACSSICGNICPSCNYESSDGC